MDIQDKTKEELISELQELLHESDSLKALIEKREAEFLIANKKLEAFSYSVSHDLKAPLRNMNGYVDLLLSQFYDFLPDKAKHYLDNIAESSRQMG